MNLTAMPKPSELHRRIGSTNYRVRIHFDPEAKETLDDKILRLLKNDLQSALSNDIISLSQTGRLSERNYP